MKENTLSLKQVILDICSMKNFAKKLLEENNSYNSILEYLILQDFYYDEDKHMPTIKEMILELNYTYSKFKKEVFRLYYDLIDEDYEEKYDLFYMNEVEYHFSLKSYNEYAHFSIKNLKEIPRVGEQIHIPFFNAKLNTRYFYVEKIEHELIDGKQIINIHLNNGFYNLFWHFRKDEAEVKREVSFHDLIHLPEYSLKEKLGLY